MTASSTQLSKWEASLSTVACSIELVGNIKIVLVSCVKSPFGFKYVTTACRMFSKEIDTGIVLIEILVVSLRERGLVVSSLLAAPPEVHQAQLVLHVYLLEV